MLMSSRGQKNYVFTPINCDPELDREERPKRLHFMALPFKQNPNDTGLGLLEHEQAHCFYNNVG